MPDDQPISDLNIDEAPKDSDTLEYLVRRLRATKKTEEDVKALRILCEEKIAKLIPGPERGQKTVTLSNGSKVTVERGFNYHADCPAILDCVKDFPPVKSKTSIELDVTGYEWYLKNDPEKFALLAQHVVATPKKVSVTIKDRK